MNIEKIGFKIVKQHIMTSKVESVEFILKMMLANMTNSDIEAVMDEIVNERDHVAFTRGMTVMFDPIDNKYDLQDKFERDMMIDANLMTKEGYLHGEIVDDVKYTDGVSPFSPEYKVNVQYVTDLKQGRKGIKTTEVRIKRANIIKQCRNLE